MKKIPKVPYRYIFIVFGAALSFFICYFIFPFKDTAEFIQFTTTVTGLIVSFSAFIFAMKTYLSIDSVNVITQMDGNVLENENYVTSFTSLLRVYDMETSKKVGDEIFKQLEDRFSKESKTAIEFATHLQYFIDIIVFFPYLFNAADENRQRNIDKMDHVLELIDQRKQAFLAVSTGNLILIDETVKLIKSITTYQQLTHRNDKQVTSTLLDVRGTMLKNSVTQTVYYNYLGLYYNKKANGILRRKYDMDNLDFFSTEGALKVKQTIHTQLSSEDLELFILYLNEAKYAFHQALENGHKDVMWEGFIKYNDARSTYLLQQTSVTYEGEDWQSIMNDALVARNRLNILISDILERETPSHLQESFNFEYHLASLAKINLLIAEKQDITDSLGQLKYAYPSYEGLEKDPLLETSFEGKFDKINAYQQEIRSSLTALQ
ncbi:hypothetical protein [Thalassobacillus hwangdonensis]|uniref:Phage abortive infection protein n=1 Tax=Thalassobacillus hwangdonensis TaxID=546108 RepID=A0ABW3L365_9BACI